jgi:hypothetical protein
MYGVRATDSANESNVNHFRPAAHVVLVDRALGLAEKEVFKVIDDFGLRDADFVAQGWQEDAGRGVQVRNLGSAAGAR